MNTRNPRRRIALAALLAVAALASVLHVRARLALLGTWHDSQTRWLADLEQRLQEQEARR